MSKLRFRVVETAFKKKPVAVAVPAERPSEYFAKYVFNKEKMFRYLPSKVYAKLTDVIDNGAPLDRSIADEVAAGMKKWAVEMGATHYTHWFHPLTEGTAEKHDAFVEHDFKQEGTALGGPFRSTMTKAITCRSWRGPRSCGPRPRRRRRRPPRSSGRGTPRWRGWNARGSQPRPSTGCGHRP